MHNRITTPVLELLRTYVALITVTIALIVGLSTLGCARVEMTRDASGKVSKVAVKSSAEATAATQSKAGRKASTKAASKPAPAANSLEQMELALHNRINAQRKKHGRKPLRDNPALRKMARNYSRRMSEENFFSHQDPAGKSVGDRIATVGLSYRMLGENIAKSYNVRDPLRTAEHGWMDSKGHRENILREEFTETGVGIWRKNRSYHFTQVFLRP